jgi:hypothetical protein
MSRSAHVSSSRIGPWLTLLGLALAGCGADGGAQGETGDRPMDKPGADAAPGDDTPERPEPRDSLFDPDKPLLPWKEGNTWTYRVLSAGVETMKTVTVGPQEPVGGDGPHRDTLAYKVITLKGLNDRTESWRAVIGSKIVRYRELSFSARTGQPSLDEYWVPYKLYVDGSEERMMAGASWIEEYEETKVPVGMPTTTGPRRDRWVVDSPDEEVTVPAGTFRAVVLQRAGGTSVKTYWFVPGIGKVKETGGQIEELVSYEVSL